MRSMAITMQGNWTLRIKRGHAEGAERFAISGAVIGNGSYDATPGTSLFVAGAQWTLHVQRAVGLAAAAPAWLDVPACIGWPSACGGAVQFDVQALQPAADDSGLLLSCSMPASEADYLVHGTVSGYAGVSLFNPGRHDYLVIDSALHMHALCERHPALRPVLEKLHPDRLHHAAAGQAVGERWTPLVLPTGLPNVANGLVFRAERLLPAGAAEAYEHAEADGAAASHTVFKRVAFEATTLKAGVSMLSAPELQALAAVREAAIRARWTAEPVPALPLRFLAYERSEAERSGQPYRGDGERTELGVAVSDARGRYLFRMHRHPQAPADGSAPQRPDLIVQVPRSGGPGFETAPYNNVTNLVRIDLLLPCGAAAAADAADRFVPRLERRRGHTALDVAIGITAGRRATDPANRPAKTPAGSQPGGGPRGAPRPRYG